MNTSDINESYGYDTGINIQDALNTATHRAKTINDDSNNLYRTNVFNSPIPKHNVSYSNSFQSANVENAEIQQNMLRDKYHNLEREKKILQTKTYDIEAKKAYFDELEKNFNRAFSKLSAEKTELGIRENLLRKNEESFDVKNKELTLNKLQFDKDNQDAKLFMETYENLKQKQIEQLKEIENKTKLIYKKEKDVNIKTENNNRITEKLKLKEEQLNRKEEKYKLIKEDINKKSSDLKREELSLKQLEYELDCKKSNSAIYKKEKELWSKFEDEKISLNDKINLLKQENYNQSVKIKNFQEQIGRLQNKIKEQQSNKNHLINIFGNREPSEDVGYIDQSHFLFNQTDSVNIERLNTDMVEVLKLKERNLNKIKQLINKSKSDLEIKYSSEINRLETSYVKLKNYKTQFKDAYSKIFKLKKEAEKKIEILKGKEVSSIETKKHMGTIYTNVYNIKKEVIDSSKNIMNKLNENKKRNNEMVSYLEHKMNLFKEIKNKQTGAVYESINTPTVGKGANNYVMALDMCMKHAVMNFFIKIKFKDPFIENLKYVILKMGEVSEAIYKRELISFSIELKRIVWLDYSNVKRSVKMKSEELFGETDLESFMDFNKHNIANIIHENVMIMRILNNQAIDNENEQQLNYQKIFSSIRQITTNIQKQEKIISKIK